MDDPGVAAAIEVLSHSTKVQELQSSLMTFSLRIDADSCSKQLREGLWTALSGNSTFWRLFAQEEDATLPQLATHVLASFAGDDFFLKWPLLKHVLPKLAFRVKDFSDDLPAAELFSKDILLICLACARVPELTSATANSILQISRILPLSSFTSTPQLFQYACDATRFFVNTEKWYKDGTVRSVFTWTVKIGINLFISDQTAEKFDMARQTGAVLMNAKPPTSLKHRKIVVDAFMPSGNSSQALEIADNVRAIFLSRNVTLTQRNTSAVVVFTAGLQNWLSRGNGDLWLCSVKSKLLKTQQDIDKVIPIISVHCCCEYSRIVTKTGSVENGGKEAEKAVKRMKPEDDQTLAASLQLMEDLLEFIIVCSDDTEKSDSSVPGPVLLETHKCLREAAVSAIQRITNEEFGQPDSSGIYSEEDGLKLASFRWACRYVAQDAVSIDADVLAGFVRYGVNGLSSVSMATACLIPMFVAALTNIAVLGEDDKEKGKIAVEKCFFNNTGTPKQSKFLTYYDYLLLDLIDGIWRRKAMEVGSDEGKELLEGLKSALKGLENTKEPDS